MKKNLFSILILALVLVNLVLNVVMIFSVLPAAKKTNKMVTQICSILDIELAPDEEETQKVSMDKLAVYELSEGETMTMNFKGGEDGKSHYLVTAVSISMNTESDGYKKYGETISEKESIIKGEVSNIVSQYTMEEYQVDAAGIRSEIVKGLQEMFESDFIVDVTFSEPIYQ
ncbi:MAG: flagellar basal body-associated FliL family protein [Lachnospiraceae bacterium]|nr:flagellar basal body-associated FliL family protein [Lachnospiraceae bacterium]